MRNLIFIITLCFLVFGCNSESIKEIKYTKNILNETLPLPTVNKYSGTYTSPIFVYGGVKSTKVYMFIIHWMEQSQSS